IHEWLTGRHQFRGHVSARVPEPRPAAGNIGTHQLRVLGGHKGWESTMKPGEILLAGMGVAAVFAIAADILYTSRFVPRFKEIEKQRIVTSNQLATAKIVSENLNHVRDLVYRNMQFPGQKDSIPQETQLFDFLTTCVNDLKLKLVSVRP